MRGNSNRMQGASRGCWPGSPSCLQLISKNTDNTTVISIWNPSDPHQFYLHLVQNCCPPKLPKTLGLALNLVADLAMARSGCQQPKRNSVLQGIRLAWRTAGPAVTSCTAGSFDSFRIPRATIECTSFELCFCFQFCTSHAWWILVLLLLISFFF